MQAGALVSLNKPFNDEFLLEAIRTTVRDAECGATS